MFVSRKLVRDRIGLVRVRGRMVGGSQLDRLHLAVKDLLSRGAQWIAVDLKGVEWMNSSGLGALMAVMTTVRHAGGEVVLSHIDRVRSLFMVTQVMKIFTTRQTVRAAISHLDDLATVQEAADATDAAGGSAREHGWPRVSNGPEDWAFVRERLRKRRRREAAGLPGVPPSIQGRVMRGGPRFEGPKPITGMWGQRMIE
jgi:anti-sigma B factor antagonist